MDRILALDLDSGFSVAPAIFCLLDVVVQSGELKGLILLAFCVIGVNRLGCLEFGLAARLLRNGSFQDLVRGELQVRRFRVALAHARDAEPNWLVIRDGARRLEFYSVEMLADDRVIGERF